MVENHDGSTYRAVYTVRFKDAVVCAACLSEEVAKENQHAKGAP